MCAHRYNCDGVEQCFGREDECTESCPFSFHCGNGRCILVTEVCDDYDDCGDMSDECGQQCEKKFRCNNGSCLSLDRFCNGVVDCLEGEDEEQHLVSTGESLCVCIIVKVMIRTKPYLQY